MSAEELAAEIAEAIYGQRVIEVVIARWVKSMSDRGGHHEIGYPNPTAMLTGRLSTDETRPLFAAAEGVPDSYPEAEDRLVDIIGGLSVAETGKAVEYWRSRSMAPEMSTWKPRWLAKDSKPCWTPT